MIYGRGEGDEDRLDGSSLNTHLERTDREVLGVRMR